MNPDTLTVVELDDLRRRLRSLGHEVTDDDRRLRGQIRFVRDRTPIPQPSPEESARIEAELDAVEAEPLSEERLGSIMAAVRMYEALERLVGEANP